MKDFQTTSWMKVLEDTVDKFLGAVKREISQKNWKIYEEIIKNIRGILKKINFFLHGKITKTV